MTAPVCTTLNAIRAHIPCAEGWATLLASLGKTGPDDEPLPLVAILDSNGLRDAMWALLAVTGEDVRIRRYAVWCARQVQHLMTDPRSVNALDVAERYADGLVTEKDLAAAEAAAKAAAGAEAEAWAAARAAVAAWAAARAAAWDAAWDAAEAARAAAWAAARAAGAAMRQRQADEFRRVFGGAA